MIYEIKLKVSIEKILTFNFLFGGSDEIRTHGAFPHGSFQDCCNKPLCHTSIIWHTD